MHRLVVALVTLIALVGGAFLAAYLFIFSASTDRAATIAPAHSALYVNVYLQPSAGQQMNLSGLIGRLPGFADEATLDAKVDQVVQNLLSGTGIDYRAQVKPWLGDQLAIAGWPAGDDPSQSRVVVIAEVKDRQAAEGAVAELVAEDAGSFSAETHGGVTLEVGEESAFAFVQEMLVVASDADSLRDVVDASGAAASLAEQDRFRETMDRLDADHLASVYLDLAAVAEAASVGQQFSGLGTASAVLVAEEEGLRLSGSAPLDDADPTASADAEVASTLADWMPEGTIAEVVVVGLGELLEDAEAVLGATPDGEELRSAIDTLRAIAALGLGIDLDADVLPLIANEVGIAVAGIEGGLPSGQILLRPDDAQAAGAALDRIAERLSSVGGSRRTEEVEGTEVTVLSLPEVGEVAYAVSDDVVILGLGTEAVGASLAAHESGASLGASRAYRATFELAGTRAGTEAYVDVGAVVELMGEAAELPDDVRDILSRIGSFAVTIPSRPDQIEFHAVLTVDEP